MFYFVDDSLRLSIVVPTLCLYFCTVICKLTPQLAGLSQWFHIRHCVWSPPRVVLGIAWSETMFFFGRRSNLFALPVSICGNGREAASICTRQFVYNYTRFVVSSSPFMWICSCKVASPVVKFWSLDPENGVVIIVDGIVHTVVLYTQKHFALAFAHQ